MLPLICLITLHRKLTFRFLFLFFIILRGATSISLLLHIKLRDVLCEQEERLVLTLIVLLCSRMTPICEDACALLDPIVNYNALGASTMLLVTINGSLCDAQSAHV